MLLRRMILIIVAAVMIVALTASAAFAEITRINKTYVDPYYSSVCGFPVRDHIVETLVTNDLPHQIQIHDRGTEYLTNVRTGSTVTIQASINESFSKATFEELLASGKPYYTFRGVNYVILAGPGKKTVASGRVALKVLDFEIHGDSGSVAFEETSTPHLAHFFPVVEKKICGPLSR